MRVITGSARGMRLAELPGKDTRPTLDRVKEALFSIIQFDIEGRRVLDLFAGTGQLGIEALSRGAAEAVFIDSSPDAIKIINENLKHTRLASLASVYRGDALDYLRRLGRFDVILIDPPYSQELAENSVKIIMEFDILKENGIIVCESASDRDLTALFGNFGNMECREYIYGKVKLTVMRRSSSAEE